MDLLVTYDVNTLTKEGRRRLRKVAKICQCFGQRVEFSVVECRVSDVQRERLRGRLLDVIEPREDSLRIYQLRGPRTEIVEHHGIETYVGFKDPLIV